jgi:hypothetical protein
LEREKRHNAVYDIAALIKISKNNQASARTSRPKLFRIDTHLIPDDAGRALQQLLEEIHVLPFSTRSCWEWFSL